jgi:hypothetical protein
MKNHAKRAVVLALALLVGGASAARAQGLNLFFNECYAGGGVQVVPLNCSVNTGSITMMCSVIPGTPIAQFAAATGTRSCS